ncbi:hypothetical protein [Niabella sp.]|uniref:hypothetical protein n=1 Tax=Niabella sp. TaxID=1962976 RepID=UPI00262A123C|nr:hypothetical protein [Niabella sp.]
MAPLTTIHKKNSSHRFTNRISNIVETAMRSATAAALSQIQEVLKERFSPGLQKHKFIYQLYEQIYPAVQKLYF